MESSDPFTPVTPTIMVYNAGKAECRQANLSTMPMVTLSVETYDRLQDFSNVVNILISAKFPVVNAIYTEEHCSIVIDVDDEKWVEKARSIQL
ncbi:hypothetical protein H0H93_006807, partial [Arthromyces matolae]